MGGNPWCWFKAGDVALYARLTRRKCEPAAHTCLYGKDPRAVQTPSRSATPRTGLSHPPEPWCLDPQVLGTHLR